MTGHDKDDDFESAETETNEEDHDGEFSDDGHDPERDIAVEKLELLMGDAQQRVTDANAGDLDPSEAYRIAFGTLGWSEADIDAAIADPDRGLEGQLYDHVGSRAYAVLVLREAIAKVEAGLMEAKDAPSP